MNSNEDIKIQVDSGIVPMNKRRKYVKHERTLISPGKSLSSILSCFQNILMYQVDTSIITNWIFKVNIYIYIYR